MKKREEKGRRRDFRFFRFIQFFRTHTWLSRCRSNGADLRFSAKILLKRCKPPVLPRFHLFVCLICSLPAGELLCSTAEYASSCCKPQTLLLGMKANRIEAMSAQQDTPPTRDLQRVTRAVVWNQGLWTAGYSLTTGGFLLYFGYELGATGFLIALLLATPETVGIAGLLARWMIQRMGSRKRVWFMFSLLARLVSLGIPLLAFPAYRPAGISPLWIMVGCLAAYQSLQAVAYLAYLSWMTDLVPEHHWGRFFAKRNIAKLVVLLVVPVVGGYMRDAWKEWLREGSMPPETALLAYVAAFVIGVVVLLISMIPLLRLPDVSVRSATVSVSDWRLIGDAWRNRSLRFLLVHNWWLAFANGLTQAAFFTYQRGPLDISLGTFYLLIGVMRVVKIPVSALAGFLCDRFGNKAPLFWSLVVAGSALAFWLLATPERWWWLFAAYLLWGGFAAANISGRNLALKLSPRSDNATQLALFRQVAGLLAGVSGLLGGLWLDSLRESQFLIAWDNYRFESYQLLFLVSWIGRMTAVLWILPIHEPGARRLGWILTALWRWCRRRCRSRTSEPRAGRE